MPGAEVLARCDALAQFSEEPGCLTRTFLSPPMRPVHECLREWMAAAGGKLHPPIAYHIEHRGLLGKLYRMMHGQGIDRHTEAQTLRSLCRRTEHDVRCRQQ